MSEVWIERTKIIIGSLALVILMTLMDTLSR